MKSFVVLASILYLGVIVSAKSDAGLKKYFFAVPANVMAKCLKESNLEADKFQLFMDESTVDQEKLGCLLACTFKENGSIVNGELNFDQLTKVLTEINEDYLQEKLEIIKYCLPEGANSKNECEYIQKILMCKLKWTQKLGLN